MTTAPLKVPTWTSPAFFVHLLVLVLLAATVILSFAFAGTDHIPGWAPLLITPLAAVLAFGAHVVYLLVTMGWRKAIPAIEATAVADWPALRTALMTIATAVPSLTARLDGISADVATVQASITKATAPAGTPPPARPV